MFINSDFSELLRIFNANKVKYLVIGGYAVIQHGEPRFTKDLDLWISTEKNKRSGCLPVAARIWCATMGLAESDFSEEGYFYQMGVPPVRVDILMGIPGVVFAQAWERRMEVKFDDLVVKFISRDDLIASKRASGRIQDILDADSLTTSA